jgi:hypothetical protein
MTKRDNAKRKQFSGQHPDEEIIHVTRKFPIVLRKSLIWGLVIIVLTLIPWAIAYPNSYSWLNLSYIWMITGTVILTIYWFISWVSWYYSVYVLTTHRIMLIKQNGLFDREVSELTLNNIQNVNYRIKGLQASMFKYGDITIETLSGSENLILEKIHHPIRFQQQILNRAHKFSSTKD